MKTPSGLFDWSELDGHSFQAMCADLLMKEGFEVQDQGIGADGGIDIIASNNVTFEAGYVKAYKWAVQVKFRVRPSDTVKPSDLGNIGNLLSRFQADGYLLITNGRVTNKTFSEIRGVCIGPPPTHLANVWDNRILESKLLRHVELRKRYFGFSGSKGILIADDSEMELSVLRKVLSTLQYPVYVATTIKQAIEICRKTDIELAILDIVFESSSATFTMAGLELGHRLREIRPDIKIIYNSAYIGNREIAARIGMENAMYVSKFDVQGKTLLDIVSRTLQTPREIALKARQFENITTYVGSSLHSVVGHIAAARSLVDVSPRSLEIDKIGSLLTNALQSLKTVMKDISLERFGAETRSFAQADLREILSEAIEISSSTHHLAPIKCHFPTKPLPIWCDLRPLQAALGNLIDNALEASDQGASPNVEVTVELVEREKTYYVVTILDNGIGISTDVIPKLYLSGYSTKGGTGMGFFLANKVAEYHGGWIEIESPAKDRSTAVRCFLPNERYERVGA